jgi:thiol:disulfide interchange protein DsbA
MYLVLNPKRVKGNQMIKAINRLFALVCVSLLLLSAQSFAEDIWKDGAHYKTLPFPIKTDNPEKIEVLEVFWYGCPHCYEFNNNHLKRWESSLSEDVYFTLTPATFKGWVEHAKVFYAAKILGLQEEMHQELFDTIQANQKQYKTVDSLKPLFIKRGVDSDAFDQLFETGGFRKVSQIDQAVEQAENKVNSLKISGVPVLIVNGKYKVGVRDAGSLGNMLKVTNFLIEKERKALAK